MSEISSESTDKFFDQLKAENERLRTYESEWERLLNEQRKSLDEARRLLENAADDFAPLPAIDAWLEGKKP